MKYQLKDISIFFKSSCCTKDSDPENETFSPCQIAPEKCREYFLSLEGTDLKAGTITIGNIKYGKLAYYDQVEHMRTQIKKLPKSCKYYFRFEYQKNGQIHAHGIIYNLYQEPWDKAMERFGHRNVHADSLQDIKHVRQYLDYMEKDKQKVTILPEIRI